MSPRWGSTPRLTDWLPVSRNMTLTLNWESSVGNRQLISGAASPIHLIVGSQFITGILNEGPERGKTLQAGEDLVSAAVIVNCGDQRERCNYL
jgi:hypothetical protein